MNCPYCGEQILNNQAFCPKCGNRLIDHVITTDYQISNDNEIAIYIDKNASKIMRKGLSLSALFLGMFYFSYRKMYLLSLLFLAITILFNIYIYFIPLNTDSLYIFIGYGAFVLIFNIVLSILFNRIYVNHANRKIIKIKKKNPSKTQFEIEGHIKYSGGTNILIPIFALLLIIGVNSYMVYKLFNAKDYFSNNTYYVTAFMSDNSSKLFLSNDKSFIWYNNASDENDNYKVGSYSVYVGRRALIEIKVYNVNVSRIKDIDRFYLVKLNTNRVVKNGIVEDDNTSYIYYGLMDDNNDIELIGINVSDYFSLKKVNN